MRLNDLNSPRFWIPVIAISLLGVLLASLDENIFPDGWRIFHSS
jgi:hypothetical protein